jgi:hypothetical protein
MNLTVEIPDAISLRLSAQGGQDLSRRALEAFLAGEYRHGWLTKPELQELLSIETTYRLTALSRHMTSGLSTHCKMQSASA